MKVQSKRRSRDFVDKISYFLIIIALPLVLVDYLFHPAPELRALFDEYFIFIYCLFVVELLIRFLRTRNKKDYIKNNWVEFVIVIFPFFRLLGLVPILEEAFIIGIDRVTKKLAHPHHIAVINTVIFMFIAVLVASEAILFFEKPYGGSTIRTFSDGLWWSTVGVSNIGFAGNLIPESIGGKILNLLLVFIGMFSLSMITANIAAFFTEEDVKADIDRELVEIELDLSKVKREMKTEIDHDDTEIKDELKKIEDRIDELKDSKNNG
ncbi:MAG TPA: potassium channel family protein [Patescibacteria group bacterium]|nr:potassium channel family protein [Patescibacteria group bacterium]